MKTLIPRCLLDEEKIDLTPMIDVVFLLLVYFLWTTDLSQESDLGIRLPAEIAPEQPVQLPDEHLVDILPNGDVLLNGVLMDRRDSRSMPRLSQTLKLLRKASETAGVETLITILADPSSLHQRSIDVLNACADAQITMVTFSSVP